ncbi:MAG: butyrate kinase [Oscillospiraceae bacterium]|nr:butyrate kinase [Oscillospiraceae bacterium]
MSVKILAVNPGSTSTKIALFDGETELFSENLHHSPEELRPFNEIQDQLNFRAETVETAVTRRGYRLEDVDVFSGRGGGLLPLVGGTYEVTELLAEHASRGMTGQHPAQLASQICKRFAEKYGGRAFVVNPPDVDEFADVSRVAGLRGVYRESHIHALNQKEIALRYCAARGLKYEEANLVICHLGGGISVTAHERGRMIDSNDIIKGSGPMTPTRAGDLPYAKVLDLAYSGEYTKKQLTARLNKNGGLTDIFGTDDLRDVKKLAESGDKYAAAVYEGFIYQNAKYAGAMAVALRGKVDAIILTGGIAHNADFCEKLRGYVGWIAEVVVMPGEFELEALAAGARRVVLGEEEVKIYTGVPVWQSY